jgi:hypothetical protein
VGISENPKEMVDLTDYNFSGAAGRFDCFYRILGSGTVYLYAVLKW